jgi:type VI secretion system protein ImpD/type VI secretion system protein ImpC
MSGTDNPLLDAVLAGTDPAAQRDDAPQATEPADPPPPLPDAAEDADATVVLRPRAPAPPPAPGSVGLRADVLAGRFFGSAAAGVAERLALFIADPKLDGLATWFGAAESRLLMADPPRLRAALDRDIAALDAILTAQADRILHHARFRRVEGIWRGIRWLLGRVEPNARVKIRIIHWPWPDLVRDFDRAAEFDQSQLFKKVYEEEFGLAGGEPFSMLVVDHEVRHRPGGEARTDDVSAVAQLAAVAAAAFTPTVLAASPALLALDRFADLATMPDLSDPFRGPEYTRWRGLATREDIRFIAITLPRVLGRTPHQDGGNRPRGWRYAESRDARAGRCWINAGFAFAAIACRAFQAHGWPADVRGVDQDRIGGGLVTELPVENFSTDPPGVAPRPVLEVALTDRQERALVEAGMMPVSALHLSTEALFSAARSLQAPGKYQGVTAQNAEANARLSAQFSAMLCVSRFAHYVKVLGRDMLGSFRTPDEIENRLQTWITNYVNARAGSSPDLRARYPLAGARVKVTEKPGSPGTFGCTVQLQPHFQLDDMSATFRLVTEFVGKAA